MEKISGEDVRPVRDAEALSKPDGSDEENLEDFPPTKVVIPAMAALYLAVFLVSLDRTILGTATPSITNDFNSFGDLAWYEAGFLLPFGVFQLTFGRVYTFYSAKWVLITMVAIFEIGSIVAAAAPTSKALIVGRVVTGIGGAGIQSGGQILMTTIIPLKTRPIYIGFIGAIFGLASILGPLLGGFLTTITWRWCFWINVPIGGVSLIALAVLTPSRPAPVKPADTLSGKIKQLDPLGFVLVAPATVCLIFALQWGGVQYAWNDGRIIALFVIFGVFGAAFVGAQAWRKDKATVPPRIFLQRSILVGVMVSLCLGSLLVVYAYYLPIWFQAIQGKSSAASGLSLLPLFLSSTLFVIACGIATTKAGYYTPFLIFGGAVSVVGAALLSTLKVDSGPGMWIGYQIAVGIGLGTVLTTPSIAAQTVLSKVDVPIGLTLLNFVQLLGGTIFVAVAQTLLGNQLVAGLQGKIQGFNPASIASQGVTSLRMLVPSSELPLVLDIYNDALKAIWYLGLGLAALMFVASPGMEWASVKKNKSSSVA